MRKAKEALILNIFDFNSYRRFLKEYLARQERGELGRMARAIYVSPTLMSLVLKDEKNLSLEQSLELTEYLHLSDLDADYFMALVEWDRAGTHKLQSRMQKKLENLRQQATQLSKRIKKDKDLNGEAASIYYSSWLYTGIRNYASLEGGVTANEMAKRFQIPIPMIHNILQFLIEHHLIKEKNGKFTYEVQNTHLSSQSPWVNQQHRNWRIKGLEKMEYRKESDLFYTCPMSLSAEDIVQIRSLLPSFIQQVQKIIGPSISENVMCLNIDWFEY